MVTADCARRHHQDSRHLALPSNLERERERGGGEREREREGERGRERERGGEERVE